MIATLSVQWKVAASLMAFSGVFIVILGYFSFEFGASALVDATRSDLASAVNEKEKALEFWRKHRLAMLVAVSKSEHRLDTESSLITASRGLHVSQDDRISTDAGLSNWVGPDKPFQSILVLAPDTGRVLIATDDSEVGTFKENREYFIKGRKAPVTVGPFYSVTLGKAIIAAATPVESESGKVVAVLVARLDMDDVDSIMRRRGGAYRTFDAYLVNTARLFVSQPREAEDPAVLSRGVFLPYVARCLKGETGWSVGDDFRGVAIIAAYRWSPALGLCVLAKLDQSEAFASSRLLGWIILVGCGLMIVIAGLISYFLSKWITHPIMRLHGATRSISLGDMSVRLDPKGGDEIAQLMHGFNGMVASLESKDRQIAEYTTSLERRVDERTEELREAQAELVEKERLATLGRLAATVSHELRNPLGTIANSLTVVNGLVAGRDSKLHRPLELMRRSIARCDHIIAEMLDFARERDPLLEPVDLDAWLADVLAEQAVADDIELRFDPNANGAVVSIDADMLRRAVINLYDNACDAMHGESASAEAGRGNVLIVTTRCVDGIAEIAIADNGPGITSAVMANVFEPLFSTKSFGVGLGLPIVKNIVERHDGTLEISSEPGHFTRVVLRLPAQPPGKSPARVARDREELVTGLPGRAGTSDMKAMDHDDDG